MKLQSISKFSGGFDVKFIDVSEHELKMIVDLFVGTLKTDPELKGVDGSIYATNQPDAEGWIKWNGGDCPIPKHGAGSFMVRFRDGTEESPTKLPSLAYRWWHSKDASGNYSPADIIAYRLLTKP